MASLKEFFEAHDKWLQDCLVEYNARFIENRAAGEVEFSEDGDAYPHGIGGIGHVRSAVTPWHKSRHHLS